MANFKERQDQLRSDLNVILYQEFKGNKTALADALNLIPKVLRDFIDQGVTMHSKTYNNVIGVVKGFNIPLQKADVAKLVMVYQNLPSQPETYFQETFELLDVQRLKLINFFINGGKLNISDVPDLIIRDDSVFQIAEFKGFRHALETVYNTPLERHDVLSKYTHYLQELAEEHH